MRILSRTILSFRYHVLQSHRLDWRDFLGTTNPVAIALMARMRIAPNDRWRVKAASLRLLIGARLSRSHQRLISQFVDVYVPLQAAEHAAFQAEVASFAMPQREAVMDIVTSWQREGRAEGRAEGLVEGKLRLLERQLMRKFGVLSDDVTSRLTLLSSSQLTALGEALLDFTSLSDVERWLTAPPPPVNDDQADEADQADED